MMHKKKTSETEELYGELGQAFNFTYGDLEANRAGFLSFRQKQSERKNIRSLINGILVCAIMLFIMPVGIQIAEIDLEKGRTIFWMNTSLISLFMCMFLLILVPIIRDIDFGRVQRITHNVKTEKRYVFRAGDKKFLIAGDVEFGLRCEAESVQWRSNVAYHIYFSEKSKIILSVEEALPE